jgi:hypothetical protein
MKRKTIEISKLVEKANHFFQHSSNELVAERKQLQSFISHILLDTKNYKGFNYLSPNQVAPGYTYGVDWTTGKPVHQDESRIFFLI